MMTIISDATGQVQSDQSLGPRNLSRQGDERLLNDILKILPENEQKPSRKSGIATLGANCITIKPNISPRVQTLFDNNKKLKKLFEGQGKLPVDRNGRKIDTTQSGYDYSLVLALIRAGVTDPQELAGVLAARNVRKASPKRAGYYSKTIEKAMSFAQRPEIVEKVSTSDTCLEMIEQEKHLATANKVRIDMMYLASIAFIWFQEHGATCTLSNDKLSFCYEGVGYQPDSSNSAERRAYRAFMQRQTGMNNVGVQGGIFFDSFCNLVRIHAQTCTGGTWLYTAKNAVFINLQNTLNELLCITASGVRVITNNSNDYHISMSSAQKIKSFEYIQDLDLVQVLEKIEQFLTDYFTCALEMRTFLRDYILASWLVGFSGTRAILRLIGPYQCGKSLFMKQCTCLIFGESFPAQYTEASFSVNIAQYPIVLWDNLEAREMTRRLLNLFLVAASGGSQEKRKRGTDSETVVETAQACIVSAGIEPLGTQYEELVSRTFMLECSASNKMRDGIAEYEILEAVKTHRNSMLSAMAVLTSRALAMFSKGAMRSAMQLLKKHFPDHVNERCFEHLALMYLVRLARDSQWNAEIEISALSDDFLAQVTALNTQGMIAKNAGNQTAQLLTLLFQKCAFAKEGDKNVEKGVKPSSRFKEEYAVEIDDDKCLRNISGATLYAALSKLANNHKLPFDISSAASFHQRFISQRQEIEAAGFKIVEKRRNGRTTLFDIHYLWPEKQTPAEAPEPCIPSPDGAAQLL